jgi:hypothetical protein
MQSEPIVLKFFLCETLCLRASAVGVQVFLHNL